MYINNAIYTCLKHYPSLFLRSDYEASRFAVLVHIFLCLGGDYEWRLSPKGWVKVEIFQDPPDEEGDPHAMFLAIMGNYIKSDYGFEESVEFLRELERLTGLELVNSEKKAQHIANSIELLRSPVFFNIDDLDCLWQVSVNYQSYYNNQTHIDIKNIEPECKACLLELLNYLTNHPNHLKHSIATEYSSDDDAYRQELFVVYQNKIKDIINLLLT